MQRLSLAAVLVAVTVITGCRSMDIEDFEGRAPKLVLEEFFAGQTKAWGIFEDRFGNLRRQFTVDIEGTWDGQTLTLIEDFFYADGEIDQRIWTLTKTGENTYEGSADDVTGVARGQTAGNAFTWSYNLDLQVGERTWNVHFEDWMFLQDDGTMVNRAYVSKWGFQVGSATIFFQKDGLADSQQSGIRHQRAAE
ncbi:DUF3833 domain-containing protein [Algihabitans albus]|uniref:DUF3833 domain-containing protein n=1 Tax=Algihabitans albus TaxID=2164067 RepID=UPI000E5CA6D5|nr:DUF3833 domain-containing protein [Algihabitans albus]